MTTAQLPTRGALLTAVLTAATSTITPHCAAAEPKIDAMPTTATMLENSAVIVVQGRVRAAPTTPILRQKREHQTTQKTSRPDPRAVRTDRISSPIKHRRSSRERDSGAREVRDTRGGEARRASGSVSTSGVIAGARANLGIPYVWGGSTPAGFDCSGYTRYVYASAGKRIPRTAEAQRRASQKVSDPRPGDLVFFGAPAHHVGIYAGAGKMYHSPRTGKVTQKATIWSKNVTYGRF